MSKFGQLICVILLGPSCVACRPPEGTTRATATEAHKSVTVDIAEYRLYLCTGRLTPARPHALQLLEYGFPSLQVTKTWDVALSKDFEIHGLNPWAAYEPRYLGSFAAVSGDRFHLDSPRLGAFPANKEAAIRRRVLARSHDGRYLATVIYTEMKGSAPCDGHAYYEIHDLVNSSIIGGFDACFQSLQASFSGFVEDRNNFGYVLDSPDRIESVPNSESFTNKSVTAIRRQGSSQILPNLKAMMLSASPNGEFVALMRIRDRNLETELRDSTCSRIAWDAEFTVNELPSCQIVWSEDSKAVAILCESSSALGIRVYESSTGNELLTGQIELSSDGWCGPALIAPLSWNGDPFARLWISRAKR